MARLISEKPKILVIETEAERDLYQCERYEWFYVDTSRGLLFVCGDLWASTYGTESLIRTAERV